MASLPDWPAENRSFSSFTIGAILWKNGSSLTRHATAAHGKVAHLLFTANLEEPSVRRGPVTRYLPGKLCLKHPNTAASRSCDRLEFPVTTFARFRRL